jgi:hypothetical protein
MVAGEGASVLIDLFVAALALAALVSIGSRALVDGVSTHLESDDP